MPPGPGARHPTFFIQPETSRFFRHPPGARGRSRLLFRTFYLIVMQEKNIAKQIRSARVKIGHGPTVGRRNKYKTAFFFFLFSLFLFLGAKCRVNKGLEKQKNEIKQIISHNNILSKVISVRNIFRGIIPYKGYCSFMVIGYKSCCCPRSDRSFRGVQRTVIDCTASYQVSTIREAEQNISKLVRHHRV